MSYKPSLALTLAFTAGAGAALIAPLAIPPAHAQPAQPAQTAQRWEMYCAAVNSLAGRRPAEMTEIGNRAGGFGWEPFSATDQFVCFKRRPAP